MEIGKLALEYVRALAWPLTVLFLSLLFRNEVKRVFARFELETWFRNVAQGFKVDTKPFDSMNRVLARLRDANAVTPDQVMLARRVLTFCNQAIHGGEVSRGQALDVIGAASVLARDYLAWLSWGFDDNWRPSRP